MSFPPLILKIISLHQSNMEEIRYRIFLWLAITKATKDFMCFFKQVTNY
ncbi:hypothetical protein HMPREF9352_0217 [Streptococcus gallolyticus subsp. gallolyticus TX20005]|nr:hypothetical protein HMPREF9352_0217 [Streptococcus gallolyticus subsp. gallolyticus TX20005]